MLLNYLKIYKHGICAFSIILTALILRIILIGQQWPLTNSDEGTLGLMALHIAYRGELPIFFYGQGYMGPFEAYLAAILFHIIGPSLFVLRFGLILIYCLFLVSIYLLTSLLFTKKLALVTLFLLGLGSPSLFSIQLRAIGGYPETLLFGTLQLLIASWLAFSFRRDLPIRARWIRLTLYGCWGLLVGIGIWTDLLVLPLVLTSALLLLVFCWPEWRTWAPLWIIASFVLGLLPLIIYNLTVPPQENTFHYFLRVYGSDTTAHAVINHIPLSQKIVGTLLVGVPNATGANPICPNQNLPLFGLFSWSSLNCTLFQGSWSAGCLLLLSIAVFLNIRAIWIQRYTATVSLSPLESKQATVRYFARLMLLASAFLTILLFALSPVSALDPWLNTRYLFCLLVATPAIIAPLWEQLSDINARSSWKAKLLAAANGAVLVYIAVILALGYVNTVKTIPATQQFNQQQNALITDLLRLGATHIYSEYWTCDRIIFLSNEHIICGVVTNHIEPGYNRYQPYYTVVTKDPHAFYVFPLGSSPAFHFARIIAFKHQHFQRFIFDGYIVYKPA
jgi:4-amino-4-deoxy-L-arabinose transferase-like glycosyltransferase